MPTSAHLIYIPAIFILGLVLGFVWGARVTRDAVRIEQMRAEERAKKKAERAAAKAAQQTEPERPQS
jgi:hypothetical protein